MNEAPLWIDHARARLNLAMRLATRANQVLAVDGAARGPLRTVAVVASAAADVALANFLRRSTKPALGLQAAAVAADLVGWTLLGTNASEDQASTSLNSSSPFLVELGARFGPVAFVVPFVNVGVVAAVRTSRRWSTPASLLIFQELSVLVGVGTSIYERRHQQQINARRQSFDDAENARAELSAANDVMMGEEQLVDEVQRLTALLVLSDTRTPANTANSSESLSATGALHLGSQKAEVASQVRGNFAYLVDVLRTWENVRNASGMLADLVSFVPSVGLARVVVSARMADRLVTELDRITVRGTVAVSVTESSPRMLSLDVGGRGLTVTDDLVMSPALYDGVPAALTWLAAMFLVTSPRDGVRPSLSVGPAAAAGALAIYAHRSARGTGAVDRPPVVRASAWLTAMAALAQSSVASIGRVPMSLGLRAHTLVAALSWPDISRKQRRETVLLGALTIIGSFGLARRPRSVRAFCSELCWPLMSVGIASSLSVAARRRGDSERSRFAEVVAQDRADASSLGRASALNGVKTSLDEAELLLGEAELDDRVRLECDRRLRLCRILLNEERQRSISTKVSVSASAHPFPSLD